LARVELANTGMLADALIHERLRVTRLVALVVTMAPESDEIDDHVL
jgi:hypothetical protein